MYSWCQKMFRRGSPSAFAKLLVVFCVSCFSRPDPYLLGAERVGVNPARCLVVEDAPAGVRSGRAAGCKTLGLITSHTREQIEEAKPDYVVPNLARYVHDASSRIFERLIIPCQCHHEACREWRGGDAYDRVICPLPAIYTT